MFSDIDFYETNKAYVLILNIILGECIDICMFIFDNSTIYLLTTLVIWLL